MPPAPAGGCLLLLLAAALACPIAAAAAPDTMTFLPAGDLVPGHAADPHRVGFGLQMLRYLSAEIPSSGNDRVALRAGGRFGLVRFRSGEKGPQWQVGIEGGFNAQFDADHSLDNIGWDGRYGIVVTTAAEGAPAYTIAVLHDSSHVGDEYMERTGRTRIGYTRHEIAASVSWTPAARFRAYAGAGWGYQLSNDRLQEPGRVQAGLEYASGRPGWYAAADLSSMQERDWRLDRSVQAGVATTADGRTWRFGVEWYRGRPPMGEFFRYTEEYVSAGIWVDL